MAEDGMIADDTIQPDDDADIQTQTEDEDQSQSPDGEDQGGQESQQEILERLAKAGGIDLRSKYKTDADFIKGFKELQAKLHERDQDAALGRVFREHEEEFKAYLASVRNQARGEPQRQDRDEPSPSTDRVASVDEYYVLQARVIDPKTGSVREDAQPEDVKRFKAIHSQLEKNIVALGLKTKEAIAEAVHQILAEKERQWQTQAMRNQAKAADMEAVDRFLAQAASWMYVDGQSPDSGYRPEGERFWQIADEIYEQDRAVGRTRPYSELMELAEAKLIKEQAMKVGNTQQSRVAGRRKPNTPSKSESVNARLEELIAKDYSMTDALNQLVKEGYNLEDIQ